MSLVSGDLDLLALAGQTVLLIETPEAYRRLDFSSVLNRRYGRDPQHQKPTASSRLQKQRAQRRQGELQ